MNFQQMHGSSSFHGAGRWAGARAAGADGYFAFRPDAA